MMPSIKRQASNSLPAEHSLVKRQKSDNNLQSSQSSALIQSNQSSSLAAPVIELSGHTAAVHAVRFSPDGQHLASAGVDRTIQLWNVYGANENYGTLTGHKNAILDLQWSRDGETIYSASADMTIAQWDLETGLRVRKHQGHTDVINCLDAARRGPELLVSGADDGTIGIWDPRQKHAVSHLESEYPVTAIGLAEAANEIYSGSVDNAIKVWDARKMGVSYSLEGHSDIVTSLEVSPDGQNLLSNSMDSTVRTWDVRPFAPKDRSVHVYDGAPAGFEKTLIRASWAPRGDRICAGAGDRTAVVWDTRTTRILYKLPGHKGVVNDVRISPVDENIIVSASTDKMLLLGELGR